MGLTKGKIIIPIAVIVTIVLASVASYYLYYFIAGEGDGHSKGHFSHLRSDDQLEELSLQEPGTKKACDISPPGVRAHKHEEVFPDGNEDGAGEDDDGDYYNSNDNPEDNQLEGKALLFC